MKKSNRKITRVIAHTENDELPFLESPQGFFLPNLGWLRVSTAFVQEQFPGLLDHISLQDVLKKVSVWAENELHFPFYVSLCVIFFLPSWIGFITFLGLFLLMMTQKNLLYGFGLTILVSGFGNTALQMMLSIGIISVLGSQARYVDLIFVILGIFLVRLRVLEPLSRWFSEKLLRKPYRFEPFLIWICTKESIRLGLTIPKLEETKRRLEQAIQKSSWTKK